MFSGGKHFFRGIFDFLVFFYCPPFLWIKQVRAFTVSDSGSSSSGIDISSRVHAGFWTGLGLGLGIGVGAEFFFPGGVYQKKLNFHSPPPLLCIFFRFVYWPLYQMNVNCFPIFFEDVLNIFG
jgi:hypothetical protein